MTANGPVFKSSAPAPEAGSPKPREAFSGGLQIGTPEERVRGAIKQIRKKVNALLDHSDDLEFALEEMNLHDWDEPIASDSEYDLPGARDPIPQAVARPLREGHGGGAPRMAFADNGDGTRTAFVERGHGDGDDDLEVGGAGDAMHDEEEGAPIPFAEAKTEGKKRRKKKRGPAPPPMPPSPGDGGDHV